MASQRYQVPIPGNSKYYLVWKQGLCRYKFSVLRPGDYPRLSKMGPKCKHVYPYERKAEGDLTTHTEVRKKKKGLPWRSSGKDSELPTQGMWVRSLVRELTKIPHASHAVQQKKKKKARKAV